MLYGRIFKGIDIRQHGSGNTGASNVLRLCGVPAFLIVFILDALKGFVAVVACRRVFGSDAHWLILLGGLLAIVGHTYSVFLRFGGGRGVATGLGLVFAVTPIAALGGLVVWAVVLAGTRYISVASIVAGIVTPILAVAIPYPQSCPQPYRILFGIVGLLIVMRHRPNIKRLLAGTEYKLGQKVAVSDEQPRCAGLEQQNNPSANPSPAGQLEGGSC